MSGFDSLPDGVLRDLSGHAYSGLSDTEASVEPESVAPHPIATTEKEREALAYAATVFVAEIVAAERSVGGPDAISETKCSEISEELLTQGDVPLSDQLLGQIIRKYQSERSGIGYSWLTPMLNAWSDIQKTYGRPSAYRITWPNNPEDVGINIGEDMRGVDLTFIGDLSSHIGFSSSDCKFTVEGDISAFSILALSNNSSYHSLRHSTRIQATGTILASSIGCSIVTQSLIGSGSRSGVGGSCSLEVLEDCSGISLTHNAVDDDASFYLNARSWDGSLSPADDWTVRIGS